MMEQKRRLTSEEIDFIVDFILPRPHLPPDIEESIIKKKKAGIVNQLVEIEIYEALIPELKKEIERQYVDSIISPGECVGIIGAQSMGEYSTQATLNTFHVAGVDTGSNTGVSKFQDLINASKTIKVDTLSLYFQQKNNIQSVSKLRSIVASKLTEIKLSHIVIGSIILENNEIINELKKYDSEIITCISFYDNELINYKKACRCFQLFLSKEILLKHRLHPSKIKKVIEEYYDCKCVFLPFSSSSENLTNFFILFFSFTLFETTSEETIFQQFMNIKICGIDGIIRYDFKKSDTDEWYIETRGGNLNSINCLSQIFDLRKTKTTSVWDIYNTFGIEATKQFLIQELKSVMDGVDICHIKLLVERMTYSGSIEPITRYTMRSDESPLSRASFEESFETFMKAAKYKEIEPFKGVSAAVIGGKKAEVGTYMCDIFMDIEKLISKNKLHIPLEEEEEDDELVYVE
jgi:DNA-directed RNA polymerase beta' subunit